MSEGLAARSARIVREAARRSGAGASEQARLEAAWVERGRALEGEVGPVCRAAKVNVETKGPAGRDPQWLIESGVRGEAAHEISTRGAVAMHQIGAPVDVTARTALDNAARDATSDWMHARAPEECWVETVRAITSALDWGEMEPLALERVDVLRQVKHEQWRAMHAWPHWVRALGIAHAGPSALGASKAHAGRDALEQIAHACGITGVDAAIAEASLAAWPFDRAVPPVLAIALCAREGLAPIRSESAWGGALRAERTRLVLREAGSRAGLARAARALRPSLEEERSRVVKALERHAAQSAGGTQHGRGPGAHPVLYASRACAPGWRIEHDRPVHIHAICNMGGRIPEQGRHRAQATLVRLEADGALAIEGTLWGREGDDG